MFKHQNSFFYLFLFLFCSSTYSAEFVDSRVETVVGKKLCAVIPTDGTQAVWLGYSDADDDGQVIILEPSGMYSEHHDYYWLKITPEELKERLDGLYANALECGQIFSEVLLLDTIRLPQPLKGHFSDVYRACQESEDDTKPLYDVGLKETDNRAIEIKVTLHNSAKSGFKVITKKASIEAVDCLPLEEAGEDTKQYKQLLRDYSDQKTPYVTDRAEYVEIVGGGWITQKHTEEKIPNLPHNSFTHIYNTRKSTTKAIRGAEEKPDFDKQHILCEDGRYFATGRRFDPNDKGSGNNRAFLIRHK